MFCGTLANKIINKIIKSVFNPEIQNLKKNPPPPTKVKGKVRVQRLCIYTILHCAASDLAPQTEMTTVCLAFCINPSSIILC